MLQQWGPGTTVDASTLFVELEAANYLAQTDPNAYSCKDKKLTIDHYTNFLWCKEHDQAGAIERLEQLHAEKLAGAAFEARVQKHMQALSHISNPSEHTKLMISLRCMHFSTDVTTRSIAARVLRAYASAEPEEVCGLFDYIGVHGDTPTACEGVTTLSDTPGMLRLTQEYNPKYYAAALYDLHYMTVQCLSRVVIRTSSSAALQEYQQARAGENYAATLATHNAAWHKLCAVYGQLNSAPTAVHNTG